MDDSLEKQIQSYRDWLRELDRWQNGINEWTKASQKDEVKSLEFSRANHEEKKVDSTTMHMSNGNFRTKEKQFLTEILLESIEFVSNKSEIIGKFYSRKDLKSRKLACRPPKS